LIQIVEDRWKRPDASYLEASGGERSAVKGYYYFIDSPRDTLEPEAMLATHQERTIERIMAQEMVLVVQDTTDLNFATRQRWKKAKGKQAEQDALPARKAALTVRFQEVAIQSTCSDLRSAKAITLWGVHAREETTPPGAKRIEWLLLTTQEVCTPEEAARIVEFYTRRWRIEEWHHVLKSGCLVQEHQNETAERLKRVIAIDAVLAWRIQLMTLLGCEVPELPSTVFFDEREVKLLEANERSKGKRGKVAPFSLGTEIILVVKLEGYLARPSDPPPGYECIWKGILHLYAMTAGYRLAATRAGP
jgi:hypothetical protein